MECVFLGPKHRYMQVLKKKKKKSLLGIQRGNTEGAQMEGTLTLLLPPMGASWHPTWSSMTVLQPPSRVGGGVSGGGTNPDPVSTRFLVLTGTSGTAVCAHFSFCRRGLSHGLRCSFCTGGCSQGLWDSLGFIKCSFSFYGVSFSYHKSGFGS